LSHTMLDDGPKHLLKRRGQIVGSYVANLVRIVEVIILQGEGRFYIASLQICN
jgi:hypothetical protein